MSARRFCVVGCGSIGSRHARNLAALGAGDIFLCDLDRPRAERLASEIGAAGVGDDLPALLAATRPDAVLVCTPPTSHLGVAAAAVASGAHVFCEKPLSVDLTGVDLLLADAERAGRIFMMGMCYRFHPALRRFHELLAGGTIGRLLGAQMWAGQYLPDWHPWADYRREYSAQRRLGGGVLLDSIHSLDTLRWVFGEPDEVMGMLGKVSDLEIDTEDIVAAVLRLAGGALVEVHVDYLQRHGQSRMEAIGSEGTLCWDRTGVRWRRAGDETWHEEAIACDPNQIYVDELREFVDCVTSGRRPALDGAVGRATLALAVALRTAAHEGRTVRVARPARADGAVVAAPAEA